MSVGYHVLRRGGCRLGWSDMSKRIVRGGLLGASAYGIAFYALLAVSLCRSKQPSPAQDEPIPEMAGFAETAEGEKEEITNAGSRYM